jgi:hypothetical protein|eukprot:COSAG01_NODE_43462_length_429_cov_2.021212_1_plen_79_part_00
MHGWLPAAFDDCGLARPLIADCGDAVYGFTLSLALPASARCTRPSALSHPDLRHYRPMGAGGGFATESRLRNRRGVER